MNSAARPNPLSQKELNGPHMSRVLHLRFWPDWRGANPYQKLFYDAIRPLGIDAKPGMEFNAKWLMQNKDQIDFLHIHWPEGIWRREGLDVWKEPLHLVRLHCFLRASARVGIKVIWTAHNLQDHERVSWFDRVGYLVLLRNSNVVVVHSHVAASQIKHLVRKPNQVIVMQHGNYCHSFPTPAERKKVIRDLGLDPDLPMVSCLGQLRDYKGVDIAIEAVRALAGSVQLLVAGKPHDAFDIGSILSRISDMPFVSLIPRILSDQEFADYTAASDLILLPYRRITGSGALLSAWSLKKVVIASDLAFFRESAELYPGALQLFPAGDSLALAKLIVDCIETPEEQRREYSAAACAKTEWSSVIKPLEPVLARDV